MIYYLSNYQNFFQDDIFRGLSANPSLGAFRAGSVTVKIVTRSASGSDPELTLPPTDDALAETDDCVAHQKASYASSARPHGVPDRKHLAKNLSKLRKEKNLTLDQVATALGVSKPAVWGWENGRAAPQYDRLRAIAQLFDVSVESLSGPSVREGTVSHVVETCKQKIADAIGVEPESIRVTIAY